MIAELARRTDVHMAVAFVAMGAWGLIANWGQPMPAPISAALVQGLISVVITFALKRNLDGLRKRLGQGEGLWVPPVVVCSLSLGVLVGLHLLARTPEVAVTVSVPFAVSTTYAIAYNTLRWQKERPR